MSNKTQVKKENKNKNNLANLIYNIDTIRKQVENNHRLVNKTSSN